MLVVAAVLVIDADPAAAQGPSFEAGPAEADGSPGFETSPATPAPADEVDPRAASAPRIADVRTSPERISSGHAGAAGGPG